MHPPALGRGQVVTFTTGFSCVEAAVVVGIQMNRRLEECARRPRRTGWQLTWPQPVRRESNSCQANTTHGRRWRLQVLHSRQFCLRRRLSPRSFQRTQCVWTFSSTPEKRPGRRRPWVRNGQTCSHLQRRALARLMRHLASDWRTNADVTLGNQRRSSHASLGASC